MIYYAIRQKSTGKFIPSYNRLVPKANTWREPEDPKSFVPRLFIRKQHAADALRWWLQGRHVGETDVAYTQDGPEYGGLYPVRKADDNEGVVRPAEDFEVVELELITSRGLVTL